MLWLSGSSSSLKDPGIKWFPHYGLCSYTQSRLHLPPFIHHQLKFTRQPSHTPHTHTAVHFLDTRLRFIIIYIFCESISLWIERLIEAKAAHDAHLVSISRVKPKCTAQEYFFCVIYYHLLRTLAKKVGITWEKKWVHVFKWDSIDVPQTDVQPLSSERVEIHNPTVSFIFIRMNQVSWKGGICAYRKCKSVWFVKGKVLTHRWVWNKTKPLLYWPISRTFDSAGDTIELEYKLWHCL